MRVNVTIIDESLMWKLKQDKDVHSKERSRQFNGMQLLSSACFFIKFPTALIYEVRYEQVGLIDLKVSGFDTTISTYKGLRCSESDELPRGSSTGSLNTTDR